MPLNRWRATSFGPPIWGGQHVEVWVLDRRSNCLEDHRGLLAAQATRDPNSAADYYTKGAPLDGATYAGERPATDTEFLRTVGLKQTLNDQFAVMRQLPPAYRKTQVMCGGHSLGGLTTGAFANWDFDGTPGHEQCAGYFVLDSRMDVTGADPLRLAGLVGDILPAGIAGTLQPANDLLPFLPATQPLFTSVASMLTAAHIAPDATSTILPGLPTDLITQAAARAVSARDYLDFALGQPDLHTRQFTNSAALGLLLDDNSMPLGYGRVSIGTFDTPVEAKSFPAPYGMPSQLIGIFGGNKFVSPMPASGRVGWTNYDRVPAVGARTIAGDTYTTPGSEVTDLGDFARAWANPVADGFEWYFPTRLLTEILAANTGDRNGDLAKLRYDVTPTSKVIYLDGGDSGFSGGLDSLGRTSVVTGTRVVAEGYNHLDVIAASWHQNKGGPEVISDSLIDFLNNQVLRSAVTE
ncbi:hypothetical protein BKP30_27790 [Rhodococcus erythropolis]|nr:hypothetical protein BKP30_27790 [Rhodococcus erythropolis]